MSGSAAVARFESVDSITGTGARIRARRKSLGMQAGRLAAMAEVSREHLSSVENRHSEPTEEWVRRVELAMDRYAHETGQDEPESEPLAGPVVERVTQVEGAPGLARVEVPTLHGGKAIVVEWPVTDPEGLAAAVDAIMRRLYPSD